MGRLWAVVCIFVTLILDWNALLFSDHNEFILSEKIKRTFYIIMFKQYLDANYGSSSGSDEGGNIFLTSLCLLKISPTQRELPVPISKWFGCTTYMRLSTKQNFLEQTVKYLNINTDIFGTFVIHNDTNLHQGEANQIVKTSLRNLRNVTPLNSV